jgi:hypothetical protein
MFRRLGRGLVSPGMHFVHTVSTQDGLELSTLQKSVYKSAKEIKIREIRECGVV